MNHLPRLISVLTVGRRRVHPFPYYLVLTYGCPLPDIIALLVLGVVFIIPFLFWQRYLERILTLFIPNGLLSCSKCEKPRFL